jgi:hypothetical protein
MTICSEVITYPQYGETCWFNALIMAVLYSQHSRNLILAKADKYPSGILIFDVIKKILKEKYIRNKDYDEDFGFFNLYKPEYILKTLHSHDSSTFMFDIDKFRHGFTSEFYVKKLYKLLDISTLILDIRNNKFYYSYYNNIKKIIPPEGTNTNLKWQPNYNNPNDIKNAFDSNPDVLLLFENLLNIEYDSLYLLNDNTKTQELLTFKKEITFNNEVYILDSAIIVNWNSKQIKRGHAIAGITCNNERFVYNGWINSTRDSSMIVKNNKNNNPCELMKYDWNPLSKSNFCLNHNACKLELGTSKIDLCFSFGKPKRLFFYIKKSLVGIKDEEIKSKCPEGYEISSIKGNCVKKCKEGQVRSPTSNRCIKICPIDEKRSIKTNKCKNTECKEGYEISPISGNCVKKCKEGQIRAATGRCTKNKDKETAIIQQKNHFIMNGTHYFDYKELKKIPVNLIDATKTTLVSLAKLMNLKKISLLKKEELVNLIKPHLIFN